MMCLFLTLIIFKRGDIWVYGIAVLRFFLYGNSVIEILTCGIAVSSSPPPGGVLDISLGGEARPGPSYPGPGYDKNR